jgi:hypothetical protein
MSRHKRKETPMTEPKNTTYKNVYCALAAAQEIMEPLIKGAINPAFKDEKNPAKKNGTPYADLSDVVATVRGPFAQCGLAHFSHLVRSEVGMDWRTVVYHGDSDTFVECCVPLIVDRNNMQGMKSAITYAKRIGLESLSGLAPEDDDGNAAASAPPAKFAPITRTPSGQPAQKGPDVAAMISDIDGAMTGQELLGVLNKIGVNNSIPEVAQARIDRIVTLVKGAQNIAVIDAFAKSFAPDWSHVEADANARKAELQSAAALGGDHIPY